MVKHNGMHVWIASRKECDAYLHKSIKTSFSITFDPTTYLPQIFMPVVLGDFVVLIFCLKVRYTA